MGGPSPPPYVPPPPVPTDAELAAEEDASAARAQARAEKQAQEKDLELRKTSNDERLKQLRLASNTTRASNIVAGAYRPGDSSSAETLSKKLLKL